MREIFSAFGSEVFRPVMTLLIPGAIALSTWIVGLLQRSPSLYALVNANHFETGLVLLFLSVAVGQVLEDLGARVEVCCFDRMLRRRRGYENHMQEWFAYLRLAFKAEPVGHRYLRTLVLRMKFELGTALALVPCGVGCFYTTLPTISSAVWLSVCAAGSVYLLVEAKSGHTVSSKIRREVLKGVTVVECADAQQPPAKGVARVA